MRFKLDHIFIMVSKGAPEANQLIQFGLSEGEPNIHPRQGTSNRRFFFQNFMLELIWVHNSKEAKSKMTKPTFLLERWASRDQKSPFGICLRPDKELENILPFKCWEYHPAYLPNSEAFFISESSKNLNEPMIFISPFDGHQDKAKKVPKVNHSIDFKKITSVCIHLPAVEQVSDALKFVSSMKNMSFKKSKKHSLEFGFDHETEGKSKNFHSKLPLLIKW